MAIENLQSFILSFSKKHILELFFLTLSAILIVASVVFFTMSNREQLSVIVPSPGITLKEPRVTEAKAPFVVHIAGAVKNPDVYEIPQGERLSYAIKKAGGLTKDADAAFFARNFNLAQLITDQEKFYIPTITEVANGVVMGVAIEPPHTSTDQPIKLSINKADQSQLESLPGIGAVTAGKIISLRPYSSVDELVAKKVMGQSMFSKIKELITP